MSLSALASLDQLRTRIPGGIEADDEERAQAALDDASALIRAEAHQTWDTEIPDVAVTVCLAAARRAMVNPDGVTEEALDGFSTTYRNDSADVYLTQNERRLVNQASGRTGVGVLPTTRATASPDVPYLLDCDYTDPDVGPGDPIPYGNPDDGPY